MVLPFLVYAACFKMHFMVLNRSGPGDAQMSSLFQSHLIGNDFGESPLEVAYGSKLTLKNYGYGGGLLHSHVQTFPVGSLQQQVTCYHYKDDNNNWIITPPWGADPIDIDGSIKYLMDGDVIRLVHAPTTRNLHSHAIAAPVTKENYEVAGYGNQTIGDENDHWVVEILDDTHRSKKERDGRIHSLTTRMRFRHQTLNCYLRAANAVLPQWGFKQIEVSCIKENDPKDVHTYWNVESHWNERCTSSSTLDSDSGTDEASAARKRKALQVTFLARLCPSQRGHVDFEQCLGPRSRQGRYPGFQASRLAFPPSRPANVRMGR